MKGDPGPMGPIGPMGPMGPAGDIGSPGMRGDPGPMGPIGPQGIQGLPGEIGVTGATGPMGQKGDTGVQGPEGAPGLLGPTGAQGLMGPTGPQGTVGSFDSFFTDNTGSLPVIINIGDQIPFNGSCVSTGTAISQTAPDTFILVNPGVYYVNFIGYASAGLLSSIQFDLNGTPVGSSAYLVSTGPFTIQQAILVTTPNSLLQITVSGIAITLGAGRSASLQIILLGRL